MNISKVILVSTALALAWTAAADASERESRRKKREFKPSQEEIETENPHLLMPEETRGDAVVETEKQREKREERQLDIPKELREGVKAVDSDDEKVDPTGNLTVDQINAPVAAPPPADHMAPSWRDMTAANTAQMSIFPERPLFAMQPARLVVTLARGPSREPITFDQLGMVHTKRVHLLVVDPTFTDYQHLYPSPGGSPGSYTVDFTPKLAGGYRAWADITNARTGKREFVMADIGAPAATNVVKNMDSAANVGDYHFLLNFDQKPVHGTASIATLTVRDKHDNPIITLEPIMGAFGHLVGFYDDYRTVLHAHPVGAEPKSASERGGPELMFRLTPEKAGYVKLFFQIKVDGKEVLVPFGVEVE